MKVRSILYVSAILIVIVFSIFTSHGFFNLFVEPARAEVLTFEPQTLYLNDIDQGSSPKWNLTVKNNGTKAVTEIAVATSCSCTEVVESKDSLAPGESMQLTGRVSTGKMTKGPFVTGIDIGWTSSKGLGSGKVLIRGNVKTLADIMPNMLDLGVISGPSTDGATLNVTRGDAQTHWHDLIASAKTLIAKAVKVDDNTFLVKLFYNYPTLPLGSLNDTVNISVLDSDGHPICKYGISVTAKVVGPISAHPDAIFAGVLTSTKEVRIPFALRSKTLEKLHFVSAEVPGIVHLTQAKI